MSMTKSNWIVALRELADNLVGLSSCCPWCTDRVNGCEKCAAVFGLSESSQNTADLLSSFLDFETAEQPLFVPHTPELGGES